MVLGLYRNIVTIKLASEHRVDVFFVLLEDGLPVNLHRAGDETLFGVSTKPIALESFQKPSRSVVSTPLSPGLDHQ